MPSMSAPEIPEISPSDLLGNPLAAFEVELLGGAATIDSGLTIQSEVLDGGPNATSAGASDCKNCETHPVHLCTLRDC